MRRRGLSQTWVGRFRNDGGHTRLPMKDGRLGAKARFSSGHIAPVAGRRARALRRIQRDAVRCRWQQGISPEVDILRYELNCSAVAGAFRCRSHSHILAFPESAVVRQNRGRSPSPRRLGLPGLDLCLPCAARAGGAPGLHAVCGQRLPAAFPEEVEKRNAGAVFLQVSDVKTVVPNQRNYAARLS